MIDGEEANKASEEYLATEQAKQKVADLESILYRVMVVQVADTAVNVAHTIDDANPRWHTQ